MPVPRFLLSEMFSNDVNDKEQQDFFAAVGRALSGWQFVEGAVHRLHEAAVLPAIPGALSASFHQIQTFNGKLQATDMAVRFTLLEKTNQKVLQDGSATLKKWEKLWKRLKDKNDRRNELAHFNVRVEYEHKKKETIRRTMLRPQIADTMFSHGLKKDANYGVSEIIRWSEVFFQLGKDISKFSLEIRKIAETQPSASQQ